VHEPVNQPSAMLTVMLMLMAMLAPMTMRVNIMIMAAAGVLCARRAAMSAEPVHATSMPEKSYCSTSTTTT
jgi:hypothetical protein